MLETIEPRWSSTVIVAATGPSLTEEVAEVCRGHSAIIAVNDAYKRLPFAPVLYACDAAWWRVHRNCDGFQGEKWSSHDPRGNNKIEVAQRYGLRLVAGKKDTYFSTDPTCIHYGSNSGFQAVNLAILFGAKRIVLVGFDMRRQNNVEHFFGSHPAPLRRASSFSVFIYAFKMAKAKMPEGVELINSTPKSALEFLPFVPLQEALDGFARSKAQGRTSEIRADLHVS